MLLPYPFSIRHIYLSNPFLNMLTLSASTSSCVGKLQRFTTHCVSKYFLLFLLNQPLGRCLKCPLDPIQGPCKQQLHVWFNQHVHHLVNHHYLPPLSPPLLSGVPGFSVFIRQELQHHSYFCCPL